MINYLKDYVRDLLERLLFVYDTSSILTDEDGEKVHPLCGVCTASRSIIAGILIGFIISFVIH